MYISDRLESCLSNDTLYISDWLESCLSNDNKPDIDELESSDTLPINLDKSPEERKGRTI